MTTTRRDGLDSPFGAWIRSNPDLDSIRARLSVSDCDYWIHQYRAHHDRCGIRAVDSIMLVELKTWRADVRFAQRDTLHLVDQLLRMSTTRADGRRRTVRTNGLATGEQRIVRCFGVHTLRLSSDRPDRSEEIYWDGHRITEEMLVELLSFVRDPDSPSKFLTTTRRHQKTPNTRDLQLALIHDESLLPELIGA